VAKVFFPRDFSMVPATCQPTQGGHPPNTAYKVSFGDEDWNGIYAKVYKVQMVYDGEISGRRSPSGTDDYLRVHEAMMILYNRHE